MLNIFLPFLFLTSFGFTQPVNFKVMTFNIRYGTAKDGENSWEKRKNTVFEMLSKYDCDFIGLQEAMSFQIEDVLEALPVYEKIGRSREIEPYEGEACPILYNKEKWELIDSRTFWLSNSPGKPGSISWGAALPRICTTGIFRNKLTGQGIYIYNTHLDNQSSKARERGSILLSDHIMENTTHEFIILMGDFNSRENEAPVTNLLNNRPLALSDAYRKQHKEKSPEDATFYGWGPHTSGSGSRVDYIFTSKNFTIKNSEIIDFQVDGHYPSDHCPVMVELEVPH
jgi:endonuclease/exonuclease/phosphatase family metal-dependent hydrolase